MPSLPRTLLFLAAAAILTTGSPASPNDNTLLNRGLVTRQGGGTRVQFQLGQLNVVTSDAPAIQAGRCAFNFLPSICLIQVVCDGVVKEYIGGPNTDCTAPNYGRMIFQDTGNFYIVRDDDPGQVLFQTGTSTASGASYITFGDAVPYVIVAAANGAPLWHSAYMPPTNPCQTGAICS